MQTPTITETTPAVKPNQPSTRHLLVDERFAGLLAEDFDLDPDTILRALEDEPQKRAIAIAEWASIKDDPAGALLAWSRKHRRGAYRRRCGQPTERPDRRHGRVRGNRSAPGRASTPPSGAAVDSLRGVRVSAEVLDQIAARMGA